MVEPANPTPLTQRRRFQQYVMNTIGPVPIAGSAASAGISQWNNTPKEWEQGWGAYGKRYASSFGFNAVRQTTSYGLSIPLHEDNRYFASTKKRVWPRTLHALSGAFTARHPDGRTTFSFSATTGVLSASAISSMWLPSSRKGVGDMAIRAGFSFASTTAFCLVREFLPGIRRGKR
jgi:hypothetical protein